MAQFSFVWGVVAGAFSAASVLSWYRFARLVRRTKKWYAPGLPKEFEVFALNELVALSLVEALGFAFAALAAYLEYVA